MHLLTCILLTKAERAIYKHRDVGDLEKVLSEADKKYRRILIITDGVFSMDGDIAPMDKIVKLANEYGAMTYVDDAHGERVLHGAAHREGRRKQQAGTREENVLCLISSISF